MARPLPRALGRTMPSPPFQKSYRELPEQYPPLFLEELVPKGSGVSCSQPFLSRRD